MQSENAGSSFRILALEVRPRATGFVALESPSHLLEWGRRRHRAKGAQLASAVAEKMAALMKLYLPSVVIVRARKVRSPKARHRIMAILRVVRREAKRRSIEVQTISTRAVRQFFAAHQGTSKHQIATIIARWFPELSWKLPPKRKAWKSEDHRMVIFDAMASGLAFLNKSPPGK